MDEVLNFVRDLSEFLESRGYEISVNGHDESISLHHEGAHVGYWPFEVNKASFLAVED